MRYCLNYSGYKVFCQLKVKITQFPDGFRRKFRRSDVKSAFQGILSEKGKGLL